MGKYINIKDFKRLVGKVSVGILDKNDCMFTSVKVGVFKDNEPFDWAQDNITGLVLSESFPEIYKIEDNSNDSGCTPILYVVFRVDTVYTRDNMLHLTDEVYTFDTYKSFLEFFTEKHREACPEYTNALNIGCTFKGSNIYIPSLLVRTRYKCNENKEQSTMDFISLKRYNLLPKKIQTTVDEMLCPFVILRNDVSTKQGLAFIDVYISKSKMSKEQLRISVYDDIVKEAFALTNNRQ